MTKTQSTALSFWGVVLWLAFVASVTYSRWPTDVTNLGNYMTGMALLLIAPVVLWGLYVTARVGIGRSLERRESDALPKSYDKAD